MYLTKAEYDRGVNTFNPDGRIFQVEYAMKAMEQGEPRGRDTHADRIEARTRDRARRRRLTPRHLSPLPRLDFDRYPHERGLRAGG